jgi:hypothetical protein
MGCWVAPRDFGLVGGCVFHLLVSVDWAGLQEGEIMADSRQRLLQLIDALLVVDREAANETDSLGRLLAQIHLLDTDAVEEVMDHLNEHGYSVLARRLERHVGRLRQKADEVFHEATPDDQKQERRYLGALHSQARRLRDFLYELRSLVAEDEAEATKPTGGKPATVNERMAGTIMKNPEAMGWNSPQWVKHLKCGKSTVVATATWKKLESARLQAQAERIKDRRRKPKASDSRRD